jgi:AraC-like DNA-binding protein
LSPPPNPPEEGGPVGNAPAVETIRFSRPPGLPGIEIMAVANSRRLYRMFHETYSVCTLLDTGGGGLEWSYRHRVHSASAGKLMLMEPGELHATTRIHGRGGTFRVLSVAPTAMEALAIEIGVDSSPHLARSMSDHSELFASFARFHASVESGATVLEQESRLVGCLGLLLGLCGEQQPTALPISAPRGAVANARDLIDHVFHHDIRLEDLALAAGVSRSHLCRLFTAEVGMPPHSYQVARRVGHARTLLIEGVAPAEVASRTGFCDQSHLTRHFKAALGVTPGKYAEAVGVPRRGGNASTNVQDVLWRAV